MADDQVTETPHTTVIERRGSGGGILIGLVLLIAVAIGAVYLFNRSQNDTLRTNAVNKAAGDVGGAAKKAGNAVEKSAE